MLKSRDVLSDCKYALDLLQGESRPDTFRVIWVAAMALVRAVGHVLQKADAKQGDAISKAIAAEYATWKSDREGSSIFWNFIEEERNQVLKQYELGFFAGPVDVVAGGEVHTLEEHLFCPITYGQFSGEDCRDVLQEAITWWEQQLDKIESAVQRAQ